MLDKIRDKWLTEYVRIELTAIGHLTFIANAKCRECVFTALRDLQNRIVFAWL